MSYLRRVWPWLALVWLGAGLLAWFRVDPRWLFVANALAAVWCVGLLVGLGPQARTPLDWPIVFIIFWLPVNYWVSPSKLLSIPAAANLLVGIAIFYVVVVVGRAANSPHWPFYLYLMCGAGLLLVGVVAPGGLPKALALPDVLQSIVRNFPDTVNANVLAGALLPVGVVAGGLALASGSSARQGASFLLLVAITLMIVMTESRGAILGLAIGLGALALILGGVYARAGLVLLSATTTAAAYVIWRFGPALLLDRLGAEMAADSLGDRLEIWAHTGRALLDFPLTGIGIGAFPEVVPRLYPFTRFGLHPNIPHAHNLALQVGVDLGIPGLLAVGVISGAALVAAARGARQGGDPWLRYAAAGVFGALIAVLVHGVFDAALWGTKPAFLLWWLLALATLVDPRNSGKVRPAQRAPKPA